MIVTIILLIIAAKIYDEVPLGVKIAITILAFIIPDPIPAIDEFFFLFKTIGNISKVLKVSEAISNTDK